MLESFQDALASRLDFTRFFNQATRLIRLDTALPEAALVVERFDGREAINEPFVFELDCLSTSAHFELKALMGEQLTLRLLRADGRQPNRQYRLGHDDEGQRRENRVRAA